MLEKIIEMKEMFNEYFCFDIVEMDGGYSLASLPQLVEGYTPELAYLPEFVRSISENVDWSAEIECFCSISDCLAEFFAPKSPPLVGDEKVDNDVRGIEFLKIKSRENREIVLAYRTYAVSIATSILSALHGINRTACNCAGGCIGNSL